MSSHPGATEVVIERADFPDLLEVFGWLDRDPILNTYLVALVLRDGLSAPGDEYWIARRGGALEGLLCLGGFSGAVLPLGDEPDVQAALGARFAERLSAVPRRFQVVGF